MTPELTVMVQAEAPPMVVEAPRVPTVWLEEYKVVPEHTPQTPLGKKTWPTVQVVQPEDVVAPLLQPVTEYCCCVAPVPPLLVQPEDVEQAVPPVCTAGLLQYSTTMLADPEVLLEDPDHSPLRQLEEVVEPL